MQEDYQYNDEATVNNLKQSQKNNQNLGKSHKLAAVVLAVFGILVIVMWMINFKKSLATPFEFKPNQNINTTENTDASQAIDLRTKDTDKDGLSDYDELNIYNTSPYLEDSDSDGFSDKEEIDNDKDPNCPVGRDCYESDLIVPDKNNDLSNNILNQINQSAPDVSQFTENTLGTDQSQIIKDLVGDQSDPASIRQMLLDAGMDKRMLDQISDADLISSFNEILGQ